MHTILIGVFLLSAVLICVLVLMHSGKDSGLSGAFGAGSSSTGGSTAVAERNLTRITVIVGIIFATTCVLLARGL